MPQGATAACSVSAACHGAACNHLNGKANDIGKGGGRIARILTQLQHCRKPHADGKRRLQADGHPAAAARRVGRRRHVAQEGGEESRYVEEHMQTPEGQASEYHGRAPEKQE